ncbi:MAG TPA: hypothetical protein VMC06_06510 [Opitutaceae bacterium]|nr:hypothetical protein [Opitutaceae bacterium]
MFVVTLNRMGRWARIVPALVIVALGMSCGKPPPTQTSASPEFPVTGPEVWKVGGKNYDIEGTAFLSMGNGQTLFVVKVLCDWMPNASDKPVARALAKYAAEHGYERKGAVVTDGKVQPFSGSIGVALIHRVAEVGGKTANYGYRFNFTVADLEQE